MAPSTISTRAFPIMRRALGQASSHTKAASPVPLTRASITTVRAYHSSHKTAIGPTNGLQSAHSPVSPWRLTSITQSRSFAELNASSGRSEADLLVGELEELYVSPTRLLNPISVQLTLISAMKPQRTNSKSPPTASNPEPSTRPPTEPRRAMLSTTSLVSIRCIPKWQSRLRREYTRTITPRVMGKRRVWAVMWRRIITPSRSLWR